MRTLLLAILGTALVATAAGAGTIGVYVDPAGTDCHLPVGGIIGPMEVYVVYSGDPGVNALEFAAPKPDCASSLVFLADAYGGIYVFDPGNSQTGILLSHFDCAPRPFVVMSILYMVTVSTTPCCAYPVVAHTQTGNLLGYDCNGAPIAVDTHLAYFNGDGNCPCGGPVPVEKTTWGKIKSLYQE